MSDERNNPLWPWIVGLLIGLPLLYVVSSGPIRMVACRRYCTTAGTNIVTDKWWLTVYAPLWWASENSGQMCAKILNWYWWKFPIPKGDDSA